ncbi:hypothetical protein N6H14_17795 [Paenibacillus sp. CC-CFT747]|nr:hypothetical protein N6H14_17795 [Paenibacillus sp. CC-CFT747]
MVESEQGIYIAWNVFTDYAEKGSLVLKEMVRYALDRLLAGRHTLRTSLPAQGVATVQHQKDQSRYVAHLLYASPVKRGTGIEVIEDILPVYDVEVTLRLPQRVREPIWLPSASPLPTPKSSAQSASGYRSWRTIK